MAAGAFAKSMEEFIYDRPSSSTEATIGAFELKTALAQVGLGRYEGPLREHGFLDWERVTRITESDMAQMDFKLGDRRKLQRVVREYTTSNTPKSSVTSQSPQEPKRKRPYRRHPRPDPNAPTKPKTAYVLFGEHVRRDPALSALSFTDLAKEIGKRWKEISDEEKEYVWDAPAAKKMKEYREELEQYTKTENYQAYQKYLEDFRQGRSDNNQIDSPDGRTFSSALNPALSYTLPGERAPPTQVSLPQLLEEFNTPSQRVADADIQDMDVDNKRDKPVDVHFQEASGSVKAGLEEVHRISRSLGIHPHQIRVAAFPQEAATTKSVETFLQCTGALVYLWSHEQALHLVQSLYHSPGDTTPANAIEVFAMAAVGSYCDGHPEVKAFAEKFLEYFVYMLASPLHIGDLPRMRLFACLAICRFTNSVESARQLMSSALDIGREAFTSQLFEARTSEEERHHWWNVFRSIIFLESWFAYNTHKEPRVTHEDLDLYHPPQSQTHSTSETYQGRIFELGRLATYVALDLKNAVEQPKAAHARQYLDSLTQWHRTLPPPMQLSHLSLSDPLTLDWHTKRSLLQLHILFLGLFIEPYRRCLIVLGRYRLGDKPTGKEDLEALIRVEEQCVSAARQSARVASLVQFDNLVRAHCWILLYTSYVGCTVLLYSAAQRLLQGTREDIGLELAYASSHIGILSVCSYENEVARKMYTSLQILFNDVREVLASPNHATAMHGDSTGVPRPTMYLPLSQGQVLQSPIDVRKSVVDIARRIMDILENSINF